MKYRFTGIQQHGRVTLVVGYRSVAVVNSEADLDPEQDKDIINVYGGQPVEPAGKPKKDK